ncbi:hypothetical protein C2869_15485 [Saccharobesus litoralis]|uniref:Uncharacterized protein n=1 Tax=Saccharobesus litoralis TaxID=2172099 RepID=A0A2S0VU58_9ALTE|nr:hypothetical protein [Saccharobesus litoralis]AWB67751.1 hypothetical protein C2869_15485 [Saccharobesus litoralis]
MAETPVLKHIHLSNIDKNTLLLRLTAEQRQRFNQALLALDKVLENNPSTTHNSDGSPSSVCFGINQLQQSNLFKRLLTGQPALPFPPPTNFGKPWYALIESEQPQVAQITLSQAVLYNKIQPNDGLSIGVDHAQNTEKQAQQSINLNQHCWQIKQMNESALSVMQALRKLFKEDTPQSEIDIEALLSSQPEFILTDLKYGEFKLYIGAVKQTLSSQQTDCFYSLAGRLLNGIKQFTKIEHEQATHNTNLNNKDDLYKVDRWLLKKN